MAISCTSSSFDLELPSGAVISLSFAPLPVRLRHAFGTSHSSTSMRTNALFRCTVSSVGVMCELATSRVTDATGYGEAGLPPKKPLCYLADLNDCREFFSTFSDFCKSTISAESHAFFQNPSVSEYDPFARLRQVAATAALDTGDVRLQNLFPQARVFAHAHTATAFRTLFWLLDHVPVNKKDRAAVSGIEAALLDCWSRALRIPFFVFAGIECAVNCANPTRSFYTAGLNERVEEMKESAAFGLAYTPAIKIKLNDDVPRCMSILSEFARAAVGRTWSLDANASWTADVALQYAERLRVLYDAAAVSGVGSQAPAPPPLYMVEQPFAVEYTPGADESEDAKWRAFRDALHVIRDATSLTTSRLYADESIATAEDVVRFSAIVDGVNIKLEKAGGIRAAMLAVVEARRRGLRVWVGTMVSTCLGCSQAAQVAMLADDSDVDGGLLAFPDVFDGGFDWSAQNGALLLRGRVADGSDDTDALYDGVASHCGFGAEIVAQ